MSSSTLPSSTLPSSTPRRPSRRSIARGAAWAVPVIAVGAAAPAMAASANCPSLPVFSVDDGWTLDIAGSEGGGETDFRFGTFFSNMDPAPGEPYTATANHTLDVTLGQVYEFSYAYTAFTGWNTPMVLELLVDGVTIPGSRFDTNSSGDNGTQLVVWPGSTDGAVTFSVRLSITWDGNTYGDDFTVYPITVSCSPTPG